MTRDALVIYRKEMKNLLKDRRTLVMLLVLPLATMPLIFGTLGTVTRGQQREAAETVYPVWIQGNDDPRFRSLLEDSLKTSTARAGGEGALGVAFPDGYRRGEAVFRFHLHQERLCRQPDPGRPHGLHGRPG